MLSDGPITHIEEDKLKRNALAKKLANVVCQRRNKESYVMGIDGPWGSGKTSFINLILENVCDQCFITYRFNPWVLGSHENLVKSFLKGLADVLHPELPAFSRIYGKFQKYTQEITSANFLVPVHGFPIGFSVSKNETSLEKLKKVINKKIEQSGKKIIIVIDDLDRLDPQDVKVIVKTIKAIADFENTIFLVAYDRGIVSSFLSEKDHDFDGNEYLKKIINVNYYLPEPDQSDIWEILFSNLNFLLKKNFGTDDIDNKRWPEVFNGGIDKLVTNMRDVKLLVNSLEITLGNLSLPDVNPVDVIAVEAIRVFAPEIYSKMSANKDLFLGNIFSLRENDAEKKKLVDQIIDESISDVDKKKKKDIAVKEITYKLFPKVSSGGYGGSDWEDVWLKEKRVTSHEKFPFYFQLGVPSGLISDAELESFKESIYKSSAVEEIETILQSYDKDKKLSKFLAKFPLSVTGLSKESLERLLLALWNIEEVIIFEDRQEADFFFDLRSRFMRAGYHLVKNNISDKGERFNTIKKALEKTHTFYSPLRLLALAKDEIEKKGTSEEILLLPENLAAIHEIGLKLIEENKHKIIGHPHTLFLLYRWEQFGGEEQLKSWIEENVAQENFLNFIIGVTHQVSSSSDGLRTDISVSDLEHFDILERLKNQYSNLTDQEKEAATDKQKIAMNALLNPDRF